MKNGKLNFIALSLVTFFSCFVNTAKGQDTTQLVKVYPVKLKFSSFSKDFSIEHYPSEEDSMVYKNYLQLLEVDPSQENHHDYYRLGCSLWQLGKLGEAKKIFLKINGSKDDFYTETYRGASDVPGDTSGNIYGYGSYTYNFKNSACFYLAKIYLEEWDFVQALNYIKLADKEYPVSFSCGTGANAYYNQLKGIYSLCYYGLEKYDHILDKYMYCYADYNNGILVKSIRKKYSKEEINKLLLKAESSIKFKIDDFESFSTTILEYGTKDERSVQSTYVSGKATINLFGKRVDMPRLDLENGEVASREMFIKEFRETGFYKELIK